jgi:putative ABC transport system ATP-binding protein
MPKPIVKARNLEVTYNKGKSNEFLALQNINLEIYEREYIILFGPSGSGKSTLMYSVLGGIVPTGGEMIVKGSSIHKDFTEMDMVEYQRSVVGIVFQKFNLIPSIDVLNNVAIPQIFKNIPPHEREDRAYELLERFGVSEEARKTPASLSGGQQQRVAVARSLVNNPEILLADEPVGNLDSASSKVVMDTIERINSEDRKTIILVTHDAAHLPYAHRVYYIKDGEILRDVVNPEKRQIKRVKPGETIVTELEQLSRMYPYDTPKQLKVKSAVNFLTQDLNFDQIQNLQKAVKLMIDRKIDKDKFHELLVSPVRRGGVGTYPLQASLMAEKMQTLMEQSQDVVRFRRNPDVDRAFLYHGQFAKRLRSYLRNRWRDRDFSEQQLKVLDDAIAERVSGLIDHHEFYERLKLPEDMGGTAFRPNVAFDMSRYLEKLLAQGVSIDRGTANEGQKDDEDRE